MQEKTILSTMCNCVEICTQCEKETLWIERGILICDGKCRVNTVFLNPNIWNALMWWQDWSQLCHNFWKLLTCIKFPSAGAIPWPVPSPPWPCNTMCVWQNFQMIILFADAATVTFFRFIAKSELFWQRILCLCIFAIENHCSLISF